MLDERMMDMAKKKREHIVFDQMLKPKKSIPFSKVNKENGRRERDSYKIATLK